MTELEKLRSALLCLDEYTQHAGAGWYTYDRAIEACRACADPQRSLLLALLARASSLMLWRG